MGAKSSCLSETIELVSTFGECACKGCSCTCGVTSKQTPEPTPPNTARIPDLPTVVSPIDIAVRARMIELEHDMRNQILLSISPLNTPALLRSPAQSPDPAQSNSNSGSLYIEPSLDSAPNLNRQLSVTIPRWPTVPPSPMDPPAVGSRVI